MTKSLTLDALHSVIAMSSNYIISEVLLNHLHLEIPRDHGQRENLTPEVSSEYHRTNQDSEPRWATLPYINDISKTIDRHLQSHNIKVTDKPTATLRTTLVKAKDTIPLEAKAGVIYQVPCKGCNAKYVGETSKTLETG